MILGLGFCEGTVSYILGEIFSYLMKGQMDASAPVNVRDPTILHRVCWKTCVCLFSLEVNRSLLSGICEFLVIVVEKALMMAFFEDNLFGRFVYEPDIRKLM